MIRLTDATVLAATKLRTRKIRTITTIIISALVFSIIIAALSVTQGVFKSLTDFSHEGISDKYLVFATPAGSMLDEGVFTKPDLIERAKQLHGETVTAKKAYAKQLGLMYGPATEPLPYMSYDGDPANNRLLPSGAIADQVLGEYYATKPSVGVDDLTTIVTPYRPKAIIQSTYVGPQLMVMAQGSETYPDPATGKTPSLQDDPVFSQGLSIIGSEVTKPFMLPASSWTPVGGSIPIIVTQSTATKLLNLPKLTKNATPQDQLQRIADVRAKAASISFSACYRNEVSMQQINQAVSLPFDIKKNAAAKGYQPPAVQYQVPAADSCDPALVSKDTRTLAQKQSDAKQQQFDEKFGAVVQPQQQKINFQVVGLTPDMPDYQAANTVDGLLSALVGSSSLGATTIPQQLYDQLPAAQQYRDIIQPAPKSFGWLQGSAQSYAVEFATADEARRFIDERSCESEKASVCIAAGKPFLLGAFGSNSIALADLQGRVTAMLQVAALIAAGVAIIIMGGMIGRTVADGRRETAVFRAIGFKRSDITVVYAVYTFMLSVYVAVLALAVGLVAAAVLDSYYWSMLTVKAKLSFGASDPTREFHLFALDTPWPWLVGALIIVLGFVSMTLPLLRNIRRNPIKDMRDE